jgi:hypothetical protein
MFRHHLCHLHGAYMCLLNYCTFCVVVDKILHDGWNWVLKSDAVIFSSMVVNVVYCVQRVTLNSIR